MVTYYLAHQDDKKLIYHYYPENKQEYKCGSICVCLKTNNVQLDSVAEEDFLRRTTAAELNEMRDAINDMRKENGEPPLTEEELPTATEDEEWYWYADHAMRDIAKKLDEGNTPEKGTVMWY